MDLKNLVRKNILNLKPYTSARDIYQDGIFLDANENSFGSVVRTGVKDLNRYPDPHQERLRKALSNYLNVDASKIFFGVGSDEIIDLVTRIFCEPGKTNVIIPQPTYGMYQVVCDINDVNVKSCKLDSNFELDVEEILNQVDEQTKIIFLCSPNNPTGNLLNTEKIKLIAKTFEGIIFIDEAYIEFSEINSFVKEIENYKNVIVSRTFSKAWGLAGIRCGYCIADEFLINILFKVKAPYTLNKLTEDLVLKALINQTEKDNLVNRVIYERNRLIAELKLFDFIIRIFPTDANFILVEVMKAVEVFNFLNKKGIRVRMRKDDERLIDCLRITVGNKEENDLLIKTLKELK